MRRRLTSLASIERENREFEKREARRAELIPQLRELRDRVYERALRTHGPEKTAAVRLLNTIDRKLLEVEMRVVR